ncbi:MAG: hypothetical protein ACREVN_12865 [Gammaproteobacteria bacterium]
MPRMPKSSSKRPSDFVEQVRRNSVALISLAVALTGLGYNTWRNEQTEENRNVRYAAFEVLLKLGELERVTFELRYDRERMLGTPRLGWSYVLEIRDLCMLLPEPLPASGMRLHQTWESHSTGLEGADAQTVAVSYQPISDAITELREEIVAVLTALR